MSVSRAVAMTLAALLSVAATPARAAVAGVFQFVSGNVSVVSGTGASKLARKGTPLSAGEAVVSASGATAQIRMADGATLVVQPATELRVVEFRYEGVEDGSERVRYRLEQGGIRSITGAIGRRNKDAYLIETPVAHMGVRGTDHEAFFVTPQAAGPERAAGAYSKVNVGLTFVRTPQGEVVVAPNQVGFVASAAERPALLPSIPGFFNRSVGPVAGAPRTGEAASGATNGANAGEQPAAANDAGASGEPGAASGRNGHGRAQVLQPVKVGANGLSLDAQGAQGGAGGSAATASPSSAVGYVELTGTNQVRTALGATIASNGATLANTGADATWGVNWGSWQGGLATVSGIATKGSTHFITTSQATSAAQLAAMPASVVSATYGLVGGPSPTNQNGVAGTLHSLSVGVNFSTMQVTNYAVSATVAGASWSAAGSGSIAQFTGASGLSLSGGCTGCTGGSNTVTAQGTAHGGFVGSEAQRMITSFGLRAASQAVSGVGMLAR